RAVLITFTIGLHCLSIMPNGFFSKFSHFSNYPSFFLESVRDYAYFWDIHERLGFLMDVFFMMRGFLATYHILAQSKPKLPSFTTYIGRRWMRLAPSIVVVICANVWLQRIGPVGPFSHPDLTDPFVEPCRQRW